MRLALVLALAAPLAAAQGKFSVPAPRAASATAAEVQAALAAGDLAQAAASLSELLDTEPGTLIHIEGAGLPEWIGAVRWARAALDAAPSELGARVAALRGAEATEALAHTAPGSAPINSPALRLELARIQARFPGTQAAAQAALRLGDLELEAGAINDARRTWEAAKAQPELAADLRAALALRLERVPPAADRASPRLQPPPLLEGSWTEPLPDSLRDTYVDYSALWPVTHDGTVYVNTGTSVLAFDVNAGLPLWDSGEPDGWQELSDWKRRELSRGIGHEDLISRVATDGRIVVAAQQLPIADADNAQINGMTITVALPERRLFAFDAATGARLWDHAPSAAPGLLGASLPFHERARISAPPLIAGDLVLAPSYELVGRINLHVSAYNLYTGEPVWDRLVVSGQSRVNLFGEHESEFNSAPLTLAGDSVLVATGLGVVARLDLATGEPRWCQDYTRFELPKTNGYFTPRTTRRWHNAAPLVTEDRVWLAPADSPDLLILDRESGVALAQLDGFDLEDLAERDHDERVQLDHLVAVDTDRFWLGGDALVVFDREPLGVHFGPIPTPNTLSSYTGPAPHPRVLAIPDGPLLAATTDGVLAVDPRTGATSDLGPLDPDTWQPGNLALASGRLLVLGDDFLSGWVSWDAVIDESRRALAEANDLEQRRALRYGLANALLARAAAYTSPGEDLAAARELIELETQAGDAGPLWDHLAYELNIQEALFLGPREPQVALARWLAARKLAANTADQLAAILGAFEVLGVTPSDRAETGWRAEAREELLGLAAGDLSREVVPDELSAELYDQVPEVLARLDPSLEPLADTLGAAALTRVPIGFLADLARGARRVRAGDLEGGLEAWHSALWDFGELEARTPSGDVRLDELVLERLDALLETPAGREAYAAFEDDAAEGLRLARRAPAAERADALRGVLRRWPQSQAASEARVALLEAEVNRFELDVGSLADLAASAIPLTRRPGPDRVRAFLALARGASLAGNVELAQLFAKRLVELAPDEPGARALGDSRPKTPALPLSHFRAPLTTADGLAAVRLGGFTPVFPLHLKQTSDGARELLLVASTSGDLLAFEGDAKGQIRWTFPGSGYSSAPWERRAVALPGSQSEVIVLISSGGLAGVDPATGGLSWSLGPNSRRPVSLVGEGGLVVVEWTDAAGNRSIDGLDALGGERLWTHALGADFASRVEGLRLILCGTRVVVLGRGQAAGAMVLDATTGAPLGQLALGEGISSGDREAAWGQGSKLCVPRLLAGTGGRPNVLDVFDLDALFASGPTPPSFSLSIGRSRETAGIIHAPSGDYLWMIGVGPARANNPGDALLELDAVLGALRPVASLERGEHPVGLELGGSMQLDSDMVLVAGSPSSPGSPHHLTMRGVALPLGPLWSLEIKAPTDPRWSLYDGPMPAAILGQSQVAFIYALEGSHASMGQELHLIVADRKAGRIEQDRVLVSRLGRISGLQLEGLGSELFLFGRGSSAGRGRLEVLESQK